MTRKSVSKPAPRTKRARGNVVTKQGLAKVLGKPVKTVDSWILRGLDQAAAIERGGRGKSWKFDTAAAVDWLLEQRGAASAPTSGDGPKSLEVERIREARARADRLEAENARVRGELVEVDHVVAYWSRMVGAAKQQIRQVPTSIKSRGIVPDLTLLQAEEILGLIDDALRELAGTGVPDVDREPLDADVEDVGTAA